MCVCLGTALEKAGGREFLEAVKELRKSQGPLEVASGNDMQAFFTSHRCYL